MAAESYNGWANYPTWCVNLWLSNEEGLYREALEITARATAEADASQAEAESWQRISRRHAVADALKTWVEDMGVCVENRYAGDTACGDLQGFGADLFGWALAHVEWREIADAWLEQVGEVV